MRWSYDHPRKADSINIRRVLGHLALCVFLLLSLSGCQSEPTRQRPSPPDLSSCTRITIEYLPSTLEYFFPGTSGHEHFSPEEMHYLETLEARVVDDEELIKGFAHDVSRAVYDGPAHHGIGIANMMSIHCYSNAEELAAFAMIGGLIQTRDEHQFEFKTERTDWQAMRPPIQNLQQRVSCAGNIGNLRFKLKVTQKGKTYIAPDQWCDAIVERYQRSGSGKEYLLGFFKCPSKEEGKCHYALNPNCEPNSPPNTIRMFETEPGWNRHGGAELFTFDNHDPKGGFVVLNDRTVKFIRTEEELKQLRWE